jgi:prepilin-type N-terminal cleavage/methylation domain-containing protein
LALTEVRKMRNERGFSLIELLIVVAIILIIAAIAIPNLLRSRMAANEASAIATLRSVSTAQITYRITYPDVGYAAKLDNLSPTSGTPTSSNADLLDKGISTAPYTHSGYKFSTVGSTLVFNADAAPVQPGQSGQRSFCTDTPAAIFFSPTETGCVPGTSSPLTQ